jgi:hypothetical protein
LDEARVRPRNSFSASNLTQVLARKTSSDHVTRWQPFVGPNIRDDLRVFEFGVEHQGRRRINFAEQGCLKSSLMETGFQTSNSSEQARDSWRCCRV